MVACRLMELVHRMLKWFLAALFSAAFLSSAVAGPLAEVAGRTIIVKYKSTVTNKNALNYHKTETHSCQVETHFYFSTGNKIFVTLPYRKCSNSDKIRNEPDAKSGDFYDYSRGMKGKDDKGYTFTIKETANTISITSSGKAKPYVSDDKKYRSVTTKTYRAVFTLKGSGCSFQRFYDDVNDVWNGYPATPEQYQETTTNRSEMISCKIVQGKQ